MIKKILKITGILLIIIALLVVYYGLFLYPEDLNYAVSGLYEGDFIVDGKKVNVDAIIRSFTTGNEIDVHGNEGNIVFTGDLILDKRSITIVEDSGEVINAKLTKIFGKYIITGEKDKLSFRLSQEDAGNIVGNPFFRPSIDSINEETFIDDIISFGEIVGIDLTIDRLEEEKGEVYGINDIYRLYKYSDGFMKLTFKHDNLDEVTKETIKVMESIVRTVNPDHDDQEIELIMKELIGISSYGVEENDEFKLVWPEFGSYYDKLRYDFDITDDKGYEFHIEDGRMGH